MQNLNCSIANVTFLPQLQKLPYEPCLTDSLVAQDDSALAGCRGKRIGILIVTYNALSTLSSVLKRITPNVWENVEEIAVFDDASQDATYELAFGMKMLCSLSKLTVLKNEKNLGYGGNQKAGYRYFLEKGFDVVVLLHGDGQYAPEILSHLYAPIVAGEADAVFGSRMMGTYGGAIKGGMPLYKYVGNRILSTLENAALGMNLTEFHSGYRAYNLHALRRIDFTHMTDDFHFDTEVIIKLQHQRFGIQEVPIPTYYGSEICHVNGLRYAWDVMRSVRRYRKTCRATGRHPEFQEYFVHYPIKESKYSSHGYAQQMIGRDRDVLDLGCGQGFFAAKVKAAGNRVTGVDVLPELERPDAVDEYVSADLENGLEPLAKRLAGNQYERVLLLDVLEHLKSGDRLLQQCRDLLSRNGLLIVSLPNVANITVRLQLLLGRFDYTQRGILDRTHVRFFTRKTARQFLEENGYRVIGTKMTAMPLELAFGLDPKGRAARWLNNVCGLLAKAAPGLFGYQVVLSAEPVERATKSAHRTALIAPVSEILETEPEALAT